ncbi:hypothetical protein FI667_g8675, partial [Globisporangium splendens]
MQDFADASYARPVMFGEFDCNFGANTLDDRENQRAFNDAKWMTEEPDVADEIVGGNVFGFTTEPTNSDSKRKTIFLCGLYFQISRTYLVRFRFITWLETTEAKDLKRYGVGSFTPDNCDHDTIPCAFIPYPEYENLKRAFTTTTTSSMALGDYEITRDAISSCPTGFRTELPPRANVLSEPTGLQWDTSQHWEEDQTFRHGSSWHQESAKRPAKRPAKHSNNQGTQYNTKQTAEENASRACFFHQIFAKRHIKNESRMSQPLLQSDATGKQQSMDNLTVWLASAIDRHEWPPLHSPIRRAPSSWLRASPLRTRVFPYSSTLSLHTMALGSATVRIACALVTMIAASVLVQPVDAWVAPIVAKGNKFFNSETGEEFRLKGMAYYPRPNAGELSGVSNYDWAADEHEAVWKPHLKVMQDLGVNTIRLYSIDPSKPHDKFMCACSEAGIYVLVGMTAPCKNCSIEDELPPACYPSGLLERAVAVYNSFAAYDNTLGFSVGNENNLMPKGLAVAPCVKAFLRDTRKYVASCASSVRQVPIGLDIADTLPRAQWLQYYDCEVDKDEHTRAEWCVSSVRYTLLFCALPNTFGFCQDGVQPSAGLKILMTDYAKAAYSRPIMFGEFGCNAGTNTIDGFENQRSFYDAKWMNEEREMTDEIVGGNVFEFTTEIANLRTSKTLTKAKDAGKFGVGYFQPDNCDHDAVPCVFTPYPEYDNLKKAYTTTVASTVTMSTYTPARNATLACPATMSIDLPDTPRGEAFVILNISLHSVSLILNCRNRRETSSFLHWELVWDRHHHDVRHGAACSRSRSPSDDHHACRECSCVDGALARERWTGGRDSADAVEHQVECLGERSKLHYQQDLLNVRFVDSRAKNSSGFDFVKSWKRRSMAGASTTPQTKKPGLFAWLRNLFASKSKTTLVDEENEAGQLSPRIPTNSTSGLTDSEKMIFLATENHGVWYTCQKDHPYLVTECGIPMVMAKCPECGTVIGGKQHRFANGNKSGRSFFWKKDAAYQEGQV